MTTGVRACISHSLTLNRVIGLPRLWDGHCDFEPVLGLSFSHRSHRKQPTPTSSAHIHPYPPCITHSLAQTDDRDRSLWHVRPQLPSLPHQTWAFVVQVLTSTRRGSSPVHPVYRHTATRTGCSLCIALLQTFPVVSRSTISLHFPATRDVLTEMDLASGLGPAHVRPRPMSIAVSTHDPQSCATDTRT